MFAKLQVFLEENNRVLLKKQVQQLFLYMAFSLKFCHKFRIDFKERNDLIGLLPRLFQNISAYEIKEAAFAFDLYMPWNILQQDLVLRDNIHNIFERICKTENPTSEWLLNVAAEILDDDILTPRQVCTLIAELASQRNVNQIMDLCNGTYLLGLEVWKQMKNNDGIVCFGEEINSYMCSVS